MSRARAPRRRAARRSTLTVALIAAALSLVAALPAVASPAVPGATYSGVAAGGADITFTLSPDGTIVTSYRIDAHGDTCVFTAEGQNGGWPGAPVNGNSFEYQLGPNIDFKGRFTGAQSASGTFRLYDEATAATTACDTGTVDWTATTATAPPPGGGGPGGGGHGPSGGKSEFGTRVKLRKASQSRLSGRIISAEGACRADRKVTLWRGSHRIESTKSKVNGTFSFGRPTSVRGRRIRASVPALSVNAGLCEAGSSVFINA